jgi:hypothetical protein
MPTLPCIQPGPHPPFETRSQHGLTLPQGLPYSRDDRAIRPSCRRFPLRRWLRFFAQERTHVSALAYLLLGKSCLPRPTCQEHRTFFYWSRRSAWFRSTLSHAKAACACLYRFLPCRSCEFSRIRLDFHAFLSWVAVGDFQENAVASTHVDGG